MMEKKGNGDKRKQIQGGGGKYKEYFLKRILIRKAIIVLREKKKKGLGDPRDLSPSETKSSFSPTPSGKAIWPEPRNTFRKTNVKGETGAALLSCPWAALPGLTPQRRGRRADRQPPREPLGETPFPPPLGKQKNFSVFGEYSRNSSEKDLFLLSAHGAERGLLSSSVGETMGTPARSTFLRMATPPPVTAAPRPCHPQCPAAPA